MDEIDRPNDLTGSEAREQLGSRRIDPVELVTSCLENIERTDPILRAWTTVDRNGALERAAQVRKMDPAAPLWGIPFGIKDIIDVAGLPTTAGSKILAGNIAVSDARVVHLLKEAGAVIIGKTNTHEFAYGITTPPTTNPWDSKRIPGGSSGGSAAAVAASHCLGALGTDTGGSIRIPSSLCGVSGLKTSSGAISMEGVIPLAPSLDAVGPIARTALDVALILVATGGGIDWMRLRSGRLLEEGFRLLLPHDAMLPELDPEVAKAYEDSVERLQGLAGSVSEMPGDAPSFSDFDPPRLVMLMVEALRVHRSRGWWPDHAGEYSDETRSYLQYAATTYDAADGNETDAATTYDAADGNETDSGAGALGRYQQARESCRILAERFSSSLDGNGILAVPTVPRVAPTHEEAAMSGEDPRRPMVGELTRIPGAINVTGLPALSVPCGFNRDGLPIGLQLIGRNESLLIEVGIAYQRHTDWHTRRPRISAG